MSEMSFLMKGSDTPLSRSLIIFRISRNNDICFCRLGYRATARKLKRFYWQRRHPLGDT